MHVRVFSRYFFKGGKTAVSGAKLELILAVGVHHIAESVLYMSTRQFDSAAFIILIC